MSKHSARSDFFLQNKSGIRRAQGYEDGLTALTPHPEDQEDSDYAQGYTEGLKEGGYTSTP